MAHAHRVRHRAEIEVTPEEQAVDGSDERPTGGGHRREVQDLDADKQLAELRGVQSTVGREDVPQVRTAMGVALVEEPLESVELTGGLVHRRAIMALRSSASRGAAHGPSSRIAGVRRTDSRASRAQ